MKRKTKNIILGSLILLISIWMTPILITTIAASDASKISLGITGYLMGVFGLAFTAYAVFCKD